MPKRPEGNPNRDGKRDCCKEEPVPVEEPVDEEVEEDE